MKLTKRSTTELPPTVKHSAEAATFMVVGGKSMRNPHESERTSLAENAAPEQSHSRQTSRERPVSQPIGPSESLPQPGSFEAPKRTPFAGVDRTFKANLARLTQGITPAGLALAYFDWLTHLMLAPGKQLQLVEKAGRTPACLCTPPVLWRIQKHRYASTPSRRITASATKDGADGLTISFTSHFS